MMVASSPDWICFETRVPVFIFKTRATNYRRYKITILIIINWWPRGRPDGCKWKRNAIKNRPWRLAVHDQDQVFWKIPENLYVPQRRHHTLLLSYSRMKKHTMTRRRLPRSSDIQGGLPCMWSTGPAFDTMLIKKCVQYRCAPASNNGPVLRNRRNAHWKCLDCRHTTGHP